jgi:hypothetical protein
MAFRSRISRRLIAHVAINVPQRFRASCKLIPVPLRPRCDACRRWIGSTIGSRHTHMHRPVARSNTQQRLFAKWCRSFGRDDVAPDAMQRGHRLRARADASTRDSSPHPTTRGASGPTGWPPDSAETPNAHVRSQNRACRAGQESGKATTLASEAAEPEPYSRAGACAASADWRATQPGYSPSHGRRSPLRYNTIRLQNPVLIGLIQVNRDSLAVAARWSKIAPDL